jgi:predicted SAM-dependent methyltransferase
VARAAVFEAKSLVGRHLLQRKPPARGARERLLNAGCGMTLHEGWVNADFFMGFRIWRAQRRPDWMLDLRYPWACDDDYWDGIFVEHTLEHLSYTEAGIALREMRRTLKPERWVRIVVPDLGKYVAYWQDPASVDGRFRQWATGAEAISAVTQGAGHRSVWDEQLLGATLIRLGFRGVRRVSFGVGSDERIVKDHPERAWESLYFEAVK